MISPKDPFPRRRVPVEGTEMAYIDAGQGEPIVFLHGNPTSSYLWRNVIPHLTPIGRCLAPDLIGMGQSGRSPDNSYRFVDHARYLDVWFETLELNENVSLVVHDWGSALGFYWAYRHPQRVKAIAYMEAVVRTMTWDLWPEPSRALFQAMRSEAGERIILEKNVFVERILPSSVVRRLSEEEMAVYRRPFLQPGESRRPTLTWPRQVPIDGEPADVHAIVSEYSAWVAQSSLPKLFVDVEPGFFSPVMRKTCGDWLNQRRVTVKGHHFVQEDSPEAVGQAVAEFLKQIR